MLSLSGQRKALILILKDEDMEVLTWENKVLSHNANFLTNEESLDVFARFLDNHQNYPVIIIADVIEESFRLDSIAHVSANDRKAILDRKLEYLFRGSSFRTARVTSRQSTGRRDDNILLSALTKPEVIQPWIDVILSKKMAIQSITSAPYILEKYAIRQELGKTENLLLVSLEEGSGFRQTFLQNGRVLFSRSTKLDLEEGGSPGVSIRKETLHIRKYLERVKLLGLNSDLKFHVLSPFQTDEIAKAFRSTDSFESLRTQDEAASSPIEMHGNRPSTLTVVLAKTLSHTRPENVYAPPKAKRFQIIRRISQGLVAASIILLATTLLMQTPVFIEVSNQWQQRDSVIAATKPYTKEYERLSQGFPETPIPSKEMELVVSTAQKIAAQSIQPASTMNLISEALEKSPDLQITAIRWSLEEQAPAEAPRFDPFGAIRDMSNKAKFRRSIFEERTLPKLTIDGIAYSPRSYREAQAQVDSLIFALREYSNVLQVTPTKMPTDVRSDASVNTTVDDDELRAEFALEVTLKDNS